MEKYGKLLYNFCAEMARTDKFECPDYCIYFNENDITGNIFYRIHHIEGFVVSVENNTVLNDKTNAPEYSVYFHDCSKECPVKEFHELICRTGEIK